MTGIYNKITLYDADYDAEKNPFLKHVRNLVPRIVKYDENFAFCLIEKHDPKTYYCFLSKFGLVDKDTYFPNDVIEKLSLEDYFKISYRLRSLGFKINLKKIIYDSNRYK